MMYEQVAQSMHFYDFVFYEVANKTMYVFCPNCGQVHEIELTKHRKVKDIKENVSPCSCFDYCSQPKFYRSCDALNGLNRTKTVGIFRNDNGEAVLDVYQHTANFGIDNYFCNGNDDFGYPLVRYPVFTDKHVIEMRFKTDGKMYYKTRLYIPMYSHRISVGEWWQESKSWRSTFFFDIIEESLENLKGTNLEQWLQYIPRMVKAIEQTKNVEYRQMDDWIAGFFMRLHTSQAFRKLFNAGFDQICFENVRDKTAGNSGAKYYYTSIHQTNIYANWGAKKLENILKTQLSKIDKLYDRNELSLYELKELQDFAKYEKQNVELTKDNLKIANAHKFDTVAAIFKRLDVPVTKAFKYIRGTMKGHESTIFVSDYCDYLDDLMHLDIKITADMLFPRDFERMHERYSVLRREKHAAKKSKEFAKAVERYKALDYKDNDFVIKVIRSPKALISEAAKMHNCSAGYVDDIIGGKSVLFTVKRVKHSREPYCMLEYVPRSGLVIQNRGIRNSAPDDKEKAFVKSWLENIVIPTMRQQASAG